MRSTPQYKKISSGFYVSVDERGISIFKEPIWHLKKRLKTLIYFLTFKLLCVKDKGR